MITANNSILSEINVTNNLPGYIRNDDSYSKFITFLEAYFKWFNDSYRLRDFDKNIDIDSTLDSFIQYFNADFLPQFPTNISVDIVQDKVLLLKIAREFFASKGTPDSFKFLFRALFNSSIDLVLTQDFMLIASGGKWIAPKSIKIKTLDPIFLNINNYKVFGLTSKTFAIIESSNYIGKYIQLYLSDIKRLFQSGENVIILDKNNQPVYQINGALVPFGIPIPTGAIQLQSKIIGAISSITVDPLNRGQYYKVGDPVVLSNGLIETINPIGATAQVSSVTSGGISAVHVTNGGYGYLQEQSNTSIDFYSDGVSIPSASALIARVENSKRIDTTIITSTIINSTLANLVIGNTSFGGSTYYDGFVNPYFGFTANSNVSSTLLSSLQFQTISTYPISNITVLAGGGGFTAQPTIDVHSYVNINTGGISPTQVRLESYGILAPIQIINTGSGYNINDIITITGGSGTGAYANVTALTSANGIANVAYYKMANNIFPEGGMGYSMGSGLPTVSINSANGANASLVITNILSTGLQTVIDTEKVGQITKIDLINSGEDYTATPNVSLRVMDILTSNIANPDLLLDGYTYLWQGTSFTSPAYISKVSTITLFQANPTFLNNIYSIRVYDYQGTANSAAPLLVSNKYNTTLANSILKIESTTGSPTYTLGIKSYGSGTALASAKFLNGVIVDPGFYLTKKSLLSENSILQSDSYNRQTYVLSTEQSLDSYKNIVTDILHPAGTNALYRTVVKKSMSANAASIPYGHSLSYPTAGQFSITGNNVTGYSNTVSVSNYSFDFSNTFIANAYFIMSGNDITISSYIKSSNNISNTIILYDNAFCGIGNTITNTFSTIQY